MFTPAVLITGGWAGMISAEIYQPDRDSACVLPDLPDVRFGHTQDGSLTCGGGFNSAKRSCHRWNSVTGTWDLVTESLTGGRDDHTSWTPADGSGTYLMGGGGWSYKTAEVAEDKRIRIFSLKHHTE